MTFKVGDVVRCIYATDSSDVLTYGRRYLVSSVDNHKPDPRVTLKGLDQAWYAHRFELVQRKQEASYDLTRALELKEQAEAQAAHFLAQREAAIKELEDLKGVIRALNRALKESL